MSLVTSIWMAAGGACLTFGIVHLLLWCQDRSLRASLWFSGVAFSVAMIACVECALMRMTEPEGFLVLHRWGHVRFFLTLVCIIGVVQTYLGTGRLWLAWTLIGVRVVILGLTGSHADSELWVAERDLLPRRWISTLKRSDGEIVITFELSKWNLTAKTQDDDFIFTPDEDFMEVPMVTEVEMAAARAAATKQESGGGQ